MNEQLSIPAASEAMATRTEPTTLQLIERISDREITPESVDVLKELVKMRREENAHQNKISFNRSFFALKKDIATLDLYCDKQATNYKTGDINFVYCSEGEITGKLDPLLMKHGFAMMFGQKQDADRLVAEITLIHEEGHEEIRTYAVRQGATNAMKDATQADTGATTSAWRHLVIKIFGLKSRISETGRNDNLKNEGEVISDDRAQYIEELLKETGSDRAKFLAMAGVSDVTKTTNGIYDVLVRALLMKKK